jgi:hypothetical protein
MGKGLPQICGHVYCYDCGKKRNGKDGYDKTGHEDGCPHDVGVKAARKEALGSKRKREIAEEEVEE